MIMVQKTWDFPLWLDSVVLKVYIHVYGITVQRYNASLSRQYGTYAHTNPLQLSPRNQLGR